MAASYIVCISTTWLEDRLSWPWHAWWVGVANEIGTYFEPTVLNWGLGIPVMRKHTAFSISGLRCFVTCLRVFNTDEIKWQTGLLGHEVCASMIQGSPPDSQKWREIKVFDQKPGSLGKDRGDLRLLSTNTFYVVSDSQSWLIFYGHPPLEAQPVPHNSPTRSGPLLLPFLCQLQSLGKEWLKTREL